MNHPYDPVLFEALDPAERDALQRVLGEDAGASEALALWGALRARLGADLRRDLPDADLLVLYALSEADAGVLAPEEEARLIAVRPALERAVAAHPALDDVIRRIRADRDAFEAAWDEAEIAGHRAASDALHRVHVIIDRLLDHNHRAGCLRQHPLRDVSKDPAIKRAALRIADYQDIVWRQARQHAIAHIAGVYYRAPHHARRGRNHRWPIFPRAQSRRAERYSPPA